MGTPGYIVLVVIRLPQAGQYSTSSLIVQRQSGHFISPTVHTSVVIKGWGGLSPAPLRCYLGFALNASLFPVADNA